MDTLIAVVLFGAAAVGIYYWLQKRKQPKPFSPGLNPVSEALFNQYVDNYLKLGRAGMLTEWSRLIIDKGGNYVPPTLGDGLTDMEIATEMAALALGVRY